MRHALTLPYFSRPCGLSLRKWDSNPRPPGYEPGGLTELPYSAIPSLFSYIAPNVGLEPTLRGLEALVLTFTPIGHSVDFQLYTLFWVSGRGCLFNRK